MLLEAADSQKSAARCVGQFVIIHKTDAKSIFHFKAFVYDHLTIIFGLDFSIRP